MRFKRTRLSALVPASLALVFALPAARAADPPAAPAIEKVSVQAVAHFNFDQASILPEDQAQILAEVGKMDGVTWQTVKAVGHTDNIGNPAYNEKLSARRAKAVKAYLVGKGLSPAMIQTTGQGPAAPVADNSTDEGRAQNRRTEIVFQGVRGAAAK